MLCPLNKLTILPPLQGASGSAWEIWSTGINWPGEAERETEKNGNSGAAGCALGVLAWRHLPYYSQIHLCFPFPVTSGLPRGPTNYRKRELELLFYCLRKCAVTQGKGQPLHLVRLSWRWKLGTECLPVLSSSEERTRMSGFAQLCPLGLMAISTKNWLLYERSPATLLSPCSSLGTSETTATAPCAQEGRVIGPPG